MKKSELFKQDAAKENFFVDGGDYETCNENHYVIFVLHACNDFFCKQILIWLIK